MLGAILWFVMAAVTVAQETGATGFDMRNCMDCEVLTLEGATSAMILAAGIGCAVAVLRSIVKRRERYPYRGISLKLR
jgi:hypothetical protein